ncbi:MAG: biopolymer transporter ExbD [Bacteroidales bacterium]|jgi:biopolymer transport protein ExbD|nr:biopolymer transporter ExbD [Bacteroidales bacterium]
MAEIIQEEKGKGGKKKAKKHPPHIDMTPMVDLMCLLITFFMLTTAFAKAKVMDIVLPEKLENPEEQKAPAVAESRNVNIILGPDNRIFWYPGAVKPADYNANVFPPLIELDYSATGIRQLLLDKNKTLARKIADFNDMVIKGEIVLSQDSIQGSIRKLKADDDTGPFVQIKAYKEANYGNFVDILDEMNICGIGRYMFVDITWYEEKMVEIAVGKATASTN